MGTCNCNVVGCGFRPTEDELVFHYLLNKINGRDDLTSAIAEVDLCVCEPWDLPQRSAAKSKLQLWHFFYQLDYNYRNSNRANRLTKAGYWKVTGKGHTIKAAGTNEDCASMKTLVFHLGRVPNGVRTNWIIHEYRLTEAVSPPNRSAYVVCCLEEKPVGKKSAQHKGELGSSSASTSYSKAADYAFTAGRPELNAPNNELAVQIQEQAVSPEDPFKSNGLSNTHNRMQEHGPLENDTLSNGFTAEQNVWQAQMDTMEQDGASVERNACSSMILAQEVTQSQANPEGRDPLAGNNTLDYELAKQMQEDPLEPDGLNSYQNGMQEHGPCYNDLFTVEQDGWQAQMDAIEQGEASVETNVCSSTILAQGGPKLQSNPETIVGYNALHYELDVQMQEDPLEPNGLSNYQNGMQEHVPFYNDMLPNGVKQNGWQVQLDTFEQEKASAETNACSSVILAQGGLQSLVNRESLTGYSALDYEQPVQMQEDGISFADLLEPDNLSNDQNGMQEHGSFYNDMFPTGDTVKQNEWQAQLDTFEQEKASVETNACSSVILAQGGLQSLANPESLAGYNALDYEQPVQMQEDGISFEDLLEPDSLSNDQNGMQEHGSFYNDMFPTGHTVKQNEWQSQLVTIEREEASIESTTCMPVILAQGGPWSQADPEEPLDGNKVLDYEPPAQMQEQGISLEDLLEPDDLSNDQNIMQEHCPFYNDVIFPNEVTFKRYLAQAQLDSIEKDEEFLSSISVDEDDYTYEGTVNVPPRDYRLSESWGRLYNNESSETVTEMSNLQNQPVDSIGSWQNDVENGLNYEEVPHFDTYGDGLVAATPNDPYFLNTITCNSLNQPRYTNSLAEEGPKRFQLQCGFSNKETVFQDKARDVELLESSFSYKHKSKRLKTHSDGQ